MPNVFPSNSQRKPELFELFLAKKNEIKKKNTRGWTKHINYSPPSSGRKLFQLFKLLLIFNLQSSLFEISVPSIHPCVLLLPNPSEAPVPVSKSGIYTSGGFDTRAFVLPNRTPHCPLHSRPTCSSSTSSPTPHSPPFHSGRCLEYLSGTTNGRTSDSGEMLNIKPSVPLF